MKVVADHSISAWLSETETIEFDWTGGNDTKILVKHGFTKLDVESVLDGDFSPWGRITEPAHSELRWILLGVTGAGKTVAIIFTKRGAKLRPISCRPMRRKERALHAQALAGE